MVHFCNLPLYEVRANNSPNIQLQPNFETNYIMYIELENQYSSVQQPHCNIR